MLYVIFCTNVNTSISLSLSYLQMKHCSVSDPCDLCSVNISGQQLNDVKEDDFLLFDNVAYMNAAENLLSVGKFNVSC